jgi:Cyclin, N-terminal domain
MTDEIKHPFYYRNLPSKLDPKTRTRHILKLQEIAQSLGLPYYTISTCSFLYHRFTAAYPLPPTEILLAGCLSLGMKIEETFKKLNEIYSQAQYILNEVNLELSKEVCN